MVKEKYRWKYNEIKEDLELETKLIRELNLPKTIAKLLVNKGIKSVEEADLFLNPKLEDLYDPFLMKDMEKSVNRIKRAFNVNEKIMIFGDYDVDGITSIALIIKVFRLLGHDSLYYIPDRVNEGYGLNKKGIDYAYAEGVSLIVTVDCGISSIDEIIYAKSLGIDVIITDHHEPQDIIPEAYAIVNPKQKECTYPYKELAGVGVAFKLCCGVVKNMKSGINLSDFLDLVIMGTVADVVPITGENRIFAVFGLKVLNKTKNLGIAALIDVCGFAHKEVNIGNIGFSIAPRINAAGRIGDASLGVELLSCKDSKKAKKLAIKLDELNRKRQTIEMRIFKESKELIENSINIAEEKIIVLASKDWHPGVIGIVSSKITEEYSRPSILLSIDGTECKGSGRSIPGFNLYEAIKKCKELLVKYGGHEQAIGLTISNNRVHDLRAKLNLVATEKLVSEDFRQKINIDMGINPENISPEFIKALNDMKPYGIGNPAPVFISTHMEIINYKWVGKANNHLNITLKYKDSFLNAIGFNFDSYRNIIKKKQKIDIVYTADTNKWNGKTYTNLYMKDIKLPQKTLSSSLNTLIEYSNSLVLADTEIDRIKSQMGLESSSTKIIDKRNIPNRVEYIKKILPSSGKTLIIVNNYIYGWALMDQLINRSPYNIGVFIQGYGHYIKSDRQILYIAPVFEKGLREQCFSDVIIYDMFFST
ncbi:MAG TPA: single-stranded-DNA-specific exonuclease RecJ, partial [Thermoanaerobacterales bacterium]|nr:single-stranded-DNA-specific exonuclease RecJ [Thermoanaerobacterales bacterium]